MFELSPWDTLIYTLLVLALMFFISKLFMESPPAVHIRDNKNGHRWSYTDFVINFPLHCNACETFLLTATGQCCTVCGAAACTSAKCIRTVDRKVTCKSVSRCRSLEEARVKSAKPPRHRWLAGNLPLDSVCSVCDDPAGDGPGLRDLRCIWCQRCVHTQCQDLLGEKCDYGKHSNMVVPPERVVAKQGRTVASPRRKIISNLLLPTDNPHFRPLVVVGNNKSGNSDGAAVLAGFRRHLNPAQVVELGECKMEEALEWCSLASPRQCVVIACGGDGTIGWVLNTIDKLKLTTPPAIAIFPLGTGNDLARALGYGSGSDCSEDIDRVISDVENAKIVDLDRWKVEVVPKRHLRIRLPTTTIFMNNYLSIGVDALVTHNFHKARESPFYLISSRIINKLIYFSYGTKDVLERQCQNLNNKLELYMDGKKIELPEIESVVILNIPYWGAGVKPWELGSGHKDFNFTPSFSDKKLEVFCVYSSFHIAQMQVGLSEPHRVGQAREVKIKLTGSVPMQIDGEPWEQHPSEISLQHHTQVPMVQMGPRIAVS